MPPKNPAQDEVRVEVEGRTLSISNLAKVLYPNTGTTKGEVLNYYAQIAPVMLPHLHARAVTRIRWPHGTGDMSFFEKNLPSGAPSWLKKVEVPTTGSRGGKVSTGSTTGGSIVFPIVEDLATLTYLANLASLELHVHQWTVPEWLPNRMVIDLDPGSPADLHECAKVALLVRERLSAEGLSCAPVTSGSKGLHLYAELAGDLTSDEVRDKAQLLAQELQEENKLVVWKMTKSLRPGKVFLDWSQNTGAKTTISPYSLRGKLTPYVAAPRTWDEIEEGAEERHALGQLTLEEVLRRTEQHGDIFGELLHGR
ncbi:MAG TPA: non-homologous end-joining DNA ligase [Nocardioidaceae bacterium]|nr:non-homologous end-joining DNA ligase [Nocardioidaceae bacterium]